MEIQHRTPLPIIQGYFHDHHHCSPLQSYQKLPEMATVSYDIFMVTLLTSLYYVQEISSKASTTASRSESPQAENVKKIQIRQE